MTVETFSESLNNNLQPLVDRINNKFASAIIIDGGLGQGKTTLAVQIADHVNGLYGHPKIDLKDSVQLAMGGEEFKDKLLKCYEQGRHVLIYDEAGDFNSRGFISRFNKDLYRTFNIYRAYKILVILCLPSFTDLDSGLFKLDVIRFCLHLKNRTEKRGTFFGYSLKSMIYMRHAISKGKAIPAFVFNGYNPNFAGVFKDLTPERSKQLEQISTKAKLHTSAKIKGSNEFDIKAYQAKIKRATE